MIGAYVCCLAMMINQQTSPNAPGEPNGAISAAVFMVDPEKRIMLVNVPVDAGFRQYQYGIPPNAKILRQDGKPLQGGLNAGMFPKNAQINVPVTIRFGPDRKIRSMELR